MKRLLRFSLAAALLAALLLPTAMADVIWEPRDSFYAAHAEECEYLFRRYTANGAEGYVTLYQSPQSARQRENVPNGETLGCSYTYTDARGETWGGVNGDGGELRGWVRLSDCLAAPDYITFEEAHGAEFTDFDPAYAGALDGVEQVVLWTYPGSGAAEAEGIDAEWFQDRGLADQFSRCYTDPEGNYWGYVGYCYGIRNTWLCLSDPANAQLETIPGIVPESGEAVPPAERVPAPSPGVTWLAAVLVLAAAVVTAALIPILSRRHRLGTKKS